MENGATLYSGRRVLVLDGVTPPQEALVVRDGRVAGVGDAGDMTRLAGKGARRVSVRGATIMPGLIDTHPHLLHFGRSRSRSSTCPTPVTQHAYLVTEVQARRYAALGPGDDEHVVLVGQGGPLRRADRKARMAQPHPSAAALAVSLSETST